MTLNANGIALTVEEPAPGQFYWVLRRQCLRSSVGETIERAARPMPSYGLAVMAGASAMERRAGLAREQCERRILGTAPADFGPTTIAGTL